MQLNSSLLFTIFPELVLLTFIIFQIILAAFYEEDQNVLKISRMITLASYALVFSFLCTVPIENAVIFNDYFVVDSFRTYMKSLVIIGAFFCCWINSEGYGDEIDKIEFNTLVMFSVLGMLLMISSNDLISLYMAIEMQSLPLFVLASMRTSSLKSSEAGLKYFLLGALSSGLLLYGCSLIYGFAESTNFKLISEFSSNNLSIGLIVGMVFLLSGMAFKISAAPFHMWTPDVYEGAPTQVTAIFAIIPKIASITVILLLTYFTFINLHKQWLQIIMFISIFSMIVGVSGALMQQNIKRMLAYSSIAHMGYALVGLASGTPIGLNSVIIYMTIYIFMGIGVFSIILTLKKDGALIEKISDLAGLNTTHPLLASAMMILMFSMAGIPPTAGFFAKWYVFSSAIKSDFILLAIVGVLSSVVGAFYYLRIIKLMYFDESNTPLDVEFKNHNRLVTFLSVIFIIFFFLIIGPLNEFVTKIINEVI